MLTSAPGVDPLAVEPSTTPPPPRPGSRVLPALLLCALMGAACVYVLPQGLQAQHLLAIADDPAQIADHALDGHFDSDIATQEIEAALRTGDADLAHSFLELARERQVALDPGLAARAEAAFADANSTRAGIESFAMGFIGGEPKDLPSFAGTALGDLFVFGDIRDAAREGSRMVRGEAADELVLGLAGVGLALTAATYASGGGAAPARVGVSLAKAARKTGQLSASLAAYASNTMRRVVDGPKLRAAFANASLTEPTVAIRAARDAVKVERAGGLLHLARDVGRVQSKAGTQAALDGLKLAESPREMARIARLAESKGGKTRAILKAVGRGAIALTLAALDLGLWILGALFFLFGLVSSLKAAVERMTLRYLHYAKRRRLARQQKFAAMAVRG
ncbi:MAG: hypothetical protein JOZ70_13615 [Pseudolabrys sp.]|nr:hypothetical protein [Pseudolabrys sp.]MBV9956275.1 hypothetical protein [Pseudolabrys sp.]